MTIAGLDHINISTPRLEETKEFFEHVLGLVVGTRPAIPVPGYWLYAGQQPLVHLMETKTDAGAGGTLDHVAFAIEDYEGLRARFDRIGLPYRELGQMVVGLKQMTIHDPNGIKIELTWRERPEG